MAENQYVPDTVSPPGETLLETLETLGISRADLAERIGQTEKTIGELIAGRIVLTPATAIQLERELGVPASFWNNRERHYREALARRGEKNRRKTARDPGRLDGHFRAVSRA